MPTAVYEQTIPYPAEVVFAFVADAENNPRWHEHVNETRWLDPPPLRVGRRGLQTGHLFWRDWRFVAEVVEYDPPRRVVYRVIDGMKVRTALDVEPVDATSSRLVVTVTTPRLPGPLDGLASRLLRGSTERRRAGDMARLLAALRDGGPTSEATF